MTSDIDSAILDLLVSSQTYLSGQSIARELDLSRTAVWKRINKLREAGCRISSTRNRGYRLDYTPDRLLPVLVKLGLKTTIVGRNIVYAPRTDSTNKQAKELAVRGTMDGTVVLSEYQTNGQGRLNRTWVSPFGKNLLFSIIFYPPVPPTAVFNFTLFSSLAVCTSLIGISHLRAGIKWPNDIYVNNRKICGVLTEFSAHQDRVTWTVVGIGLNVNTDFTDEPQLHEVATSIRQEAGRSTRRIPLLQSILERIDSLYRRFLEGEDAVIRKEWLAHSIIIGRPVIITADGVKHEGIAESIDESGALMLRASDGKLRRIVYGDLSLRLKA
jgi:BirA family biotin operon repressor/biotin-[acetyl-CoA-carboxylase] ligase